MQDLSLRFLHSKYLFAATRLKRHRPAAEFDRIQAPTGNQARGSPGVETDATVGRKPVSPEYLNQDQNVSDESPAPVAPGAILNDHQQPVLFASLLAFSLGQRSSVLFQFSDVTKTYGAITALDNLTLSVPKGAIGLLGPNGSGKTTMIRTLLGLITVDKGMGHVLGKDFRRRQLDIRRKVGFAPEDECLFPHTMGVDFVSYAGELVGMSRKDALQRAHETLDYVGLGEARYRKVESYSTGMKQRLKLASAIVHDPKMLILDEPTNGMDPGGRQEILELSRDLTHNKGMSLLFSSHLLPDVEAVCDYVIVIAAGRLLAQGEITQLKQLHRHSYEVRVKGEPGPFAAKLRTTGCNVEERSDVLRVVLPPKETPQLLWRAAADANEQIRHLRPQRSTLEEVFLSAMEQA